MTEESLEEALWREELLAQKLKAYEWRWVAVAKHEVICDAATLAELLGDVKAEDAEVEGIFQVLPEGPCFFTSEPARTY